MQVVRAPPAAPAAPAAAQGLWRPEPEVEWRPRFHELVLQFVEEYRRDIGLVRRGEPLPGGALAPTTTSETAGVTTARAPTTTSATATMTTARATQTAPLEVPNARACERAGPRSRRSTTRNRATQTDFTGSDDHLHDHCRAPATSRLLRLPLLPFV